MKRSHQIFMLATAVLLGGCLAQSSADDDYHPGIGGARLSLSVSSSDLFSSVYVGGTQEGTITVTNVGTSRATDISGAALGSPYAYKDGSFPGTGGTCGSSLNRGLTCTIVVTFSPTSASAAPGTFTLSYKNNGAGSTRTVSETVSESGLTGVAGTIDSQTFGSDGSTTTTIGTSSSSYDTAVQTDGKLIAVGTSLISGVLNGVVLRYTAAGALDMSFSDDGYFVSTFGSSGPIFRGVAIQTDGKIVVAGTDASNQALVVRLNTDGTLDNSFDGDGIFTASEVQGCGDVALQSDGKIVIACGAYFTATPFQVGRLNTNGTWDTTFGSLGFLGFGFAITDVGCTEDCVVNAVGIGSDGKIVIGGRAGYGGGHEEFTLVRYLSDGTEDISFSGDGIFSHDVSGVTDTCNLTKLVILSDGSVVAAGMNLDFAYGILARITVNGALDGSWGSSGIRSLPMTSINDIKVDFEGRFVVTGGGLLVARVNADSTMDTTFDTDGYATFSFSGVTGGGASGLALQSDGKIAFVGSATISGVPRHIIGRVWP